MNLVVQYRNCSYIHHYHHHDPHHTTTIITGNPGPPSTSSKASVQTNCSLLFWSTLKLPLTCLSHHTTESLSFCVSLCMSASLSGCLCLSGQVSKSQLLLKFQLFLITLAFPAQQILFLFVQTSILSSAFSTYHPHQYHHHDLHHTTTITTTSISTSAKSKNTFQPALILTCTALHSNVTLL